MYTLQVLNKSNIDLDGKWYIFGNDDNLQRARQAACKAASDLGYGRPTRVCEGNNLIAEYSGQGLYIPEPTTGSNSEGSSWEV